MRARRLRWQTSDRKRDLLGRLQQDLKTWLAAWSVVPKLLSINPIDIFESALFRPDQCWWHLTGKSGALWLGVNTGQLDDLGALLAGAEPNDSLALGQRVGNRALRDLLTQMVGGLGNEPIFQTDASPPAQDCEPRFGGCGFRLEGAGFEALLWLDHDLCELRLPTPKAVMPALAPWEAALGQEPVVLEILLDLGQATLADTQGLRVGDVLVSNTPLDSLFLMAKADHRAIAGVRLFRRGDLRAIQVDSPVSMRAAL